MTTSEQLAEEARQALEAAPKTKLEAAEIHRRVYRSGGPAVLYGNVAGNPFHMVSNLFGTLERAHHILRGGFEAVRRLIDVKASPESALKRPWRYGQLRPGMESAKWIF